nr:MAG TPA: hypothetical protein [Caudoviricetes sp.]
MTFVIAWIGLAVLVLLFNRGAISHETPRENVGFPVSSRERK